MTPIRDEYQQHGVQQYYEQAGGDYRNPHEEAIADVLRQCVTEWQLDLTRVLDLACGSGEATLALQAAGANEIVGVDPYTGPAYLDRTGKDALSHTFAEVAAGALDGQRFSQIVCSYALHLIEPSRLPGLLVALGQLTDSLLILSPHKQPQIKESWGCHVQAEMYRHRIRAKLVTWDRTDPCQD